MAATRAATRRRILFPPAATGINDGRFVRVQHSVDTMRPIFINGRFLTQPLTGVQRYAGNIVHAIDDILGESGRGTWPEVRLVTPKGVADPGLRHIRWVPSGRLRGHLWDQLSFHAAARSGVALGLANSAPLLHRHSIAVLHDAAVFRHPEFFSPRYARAHAALGRAIARRARLATVSDFSRRELVDVLKRDPRDIVVAPNGTEHMDGPVDPSILSRLGIGDAPFFLTLGNRTKNKNLALVIEALALLPPGRARVVAVGDVDGKVFGHVSLGQSGDFVAAGRLADPEIRALMKRARALIFPSFYEGFGIPPLEAMHHGCPVLASTAGAVVETCGDAAAYFDPTDAPALVRLMEDMLAADAAALDARRARGARRAAAFSWKRSAATLLAAAREMALS